MSEVEPHESEPIVEPPFEVFPAMYEDLNFHLNPMTELVLSFIQDKLTLEQPDISEADKIKRDKEGMGRYYLELIKDDTGETQEFRIGAMLRMAELELRRGNIDGFKESMYDAWDSADNEGFPVAEKIEPFTRSSDFEE